MHGKSLQPFGSHVKEIDFRTFDLFHMISRTEFAELWLQALFFWGSISRAQTCVAGKYSSGSNFFGRPNGVLSSSQRQVKVDLTMPSCGFKLSKRELGHNDLGVGGNR